MSKAQPAQTGDEAEADADAEGAQEVVEQADEAATEAVAEAEPVEGSAGTASN